MSKIKYRYNKETFNYERVRVSAGQIVLRISAICVLIAIMTGVLSIFGGSFFGSSRELALKKENQELKFYYEMLNKDLKKLENGLLGLQHRDDNIYRAIFEAEPLPASIRAAGVGGALPYNTLFDKKLEQEKLIVETISKADGLKKRMYIQSKSFDHVASLVAGKQQMLAGIPAIRPVRLAETNMMSGFGHRIDPVYKTPKFHSGMDFGARTGTKIYATGAGRVSISGYADHFAGYGQCIVIDHGYGYQTLFAHLSKMNVKVGKRVRRGDVIGLVGNTGKSVGPHLHYEIIKNGQKINPVNFFYSDLGPAEYQQMLEASQRANQSLD